MPRRAAAAPSIFPAGTYACYTIRLKSGITLHLDQRRDDPGRPARHGTRRLRSSPSRSAIIQGLPGFRPWPLAQQPDLGRGLHDIAITGRADLGQGPGPRRRQGQLAEGSQRPRHRQQGDRAQIVPQRACCAISQVLEGGWFALLATGVDNLTIDNLLVDTNRDGFDIDCCKNVRVTNCTVNSPYDDAICPKSSFALGYRRGTENVMIANCLVTGNYVIGSVIDGTWKKMPAPSPPRCTAASSSAPNPTAASRTSRSPIASSTTAGPCAGNGRRRDDRGCDRQQHHDARHLQLALFLRLGRRMRGPKDTPIGTMKRILITNMVSSGATLLPSILAGIPGHPIEDVKISDVYLHQIGGAPAAMAALRPPENELAYPEPNDVRRCARDRILRPRRPQYRDEQYRDRGGSARSRDRLSISTMSRMPISSRAFACQRGRPHSRSIASPDSGTSEA
jgi:hypothetical protein